MPSSATEEIAVESPGLLKLVRHMERDPDALAAFWSEVESTGTPLFEEYDAETESWLVTFLYREDEPLDNVLLIEWIEVTDFPAKEMNKLAGTDIWYKSLRLIEGLRTEYSFAPNDSLVPKLQETDWDARRAKWTTDPQNRTPLIRDDAPDSEHLSGRRDSVLSVPGALAQLWIERQEGIERGVITGHRFASQILQNEREVWLYIHPDADTSRPVPLLVQFDGELANEVLRTPTVLDNLIAAGKLPPMAAVFVGNFDRGEELPCNPDFVKMLKSELLPFVSRELGIELHAQQTVANGVSYGGLAAMYAGLTAPETFGLVASQSGSYWWKPQPMQINRVLGSTNHFCWLPQQVVDMPVSSIRIWMESGTLEGGISRDGIPSLLDSNRHMKNVLRAKGFDVIFHEYLGGHDFAHWRNSQADALIHLLGK